MQEELLPIIEGIREQTSLMIYPKSHNWKTVGFEPVLLPLKALPLFPDLFQDAAAILEAPSFALSSQSVDQLVGPAPSEFELTPWGGRPGDCTRGRKAIRALKKSLCSGNIFLSHFSCQQLSQRLDDAKVVRPKGFLLPASEACDF